MTVKQRAAWTPDKLSAVEEAFQYNANAKSAQYLLWCQSMTIQFSDFWGATVLQKQVWIQHTLTLLADIFSKQHIYASNSHWTTLAVI